MAFGSMAILSRVRDSGDRAEPSTGPEGAWEARVDYSSFPPFGGHPRRPENGPGDTDGKATKATFIHF